MVGIRPSALPRQNHCNVSVTVNAFSVKPAEYRYLFQRPWLFFSRSKCHWAFGSERYFSACSHPTKSTLWPLPALHLGSNWKLSPFFPWFLLYWPSIIRLQLEKRSASKICNLFYIVRLKGRFFVLFFNLLCVLIRDSSSSACMMITSVLFHTLIPTFGTSTCFPGHGGVWKKKEKKKAFVAFFRFKCKDRGVLSVFSHSNRSNIMIK